ncbi:MAG: ankyrin repeat domain-containing protein [Candidatus Paceibacterota bacterium]|jgi:hypothetical protein
MYLDPDQNEDDEVIISICAIHDISLYDRLGGAGGLLTSAARSTRLIKIINLLIEHGIVLDTNVLGRMLFVAAYRGWKDLVEFLINHDIFKQMRIGKKRAFLSYAATKATLRGEEEVVEFLVARGADIPDPKKRGSHLNVP